MTCNHHDPTGRFNYFRHVRTTKGHELGEGEHVSCSLCFKVWVPNVNQEKSIVNSNDNDTDRGECCKGFPLDGVVFHECKGHRPYCAKEWPCYCQPPKTDRREGLRFSEPCGHRRSTPFCAFCNASAATEPPKKQEECEYENTWRKALLDALREDSFRGNSERTLEDLRKKYLSDA